MTNTHNDGDEEDFQEYARRFREREKKKQGAGGGTVTQGLRGEFLQCAHNILTMCSKCVCNSHNVLAIFK